MMASLTSKRSLLWGLIYLPNALSLPGPAFIAREQSGTKNDGSFAARAENVLARAIQITPTDGSVTNYTYAGCYTDANPLSLIPQFVLNAAATSSSTSTTWASCTSFCAGYQYAGIDSGSTCRCGNSFAYTPILARDASCITPCTGNATQSCGGVNLLTVFRNNNYGSAISSSRTSSTVLTPVGSSQVPTTLLVSVASSSTRLSSSSTVSTASVASSSTHPSSSATMSTASSRAGTTAITSPTSAAVINPLAPLFPSSPAPILAPLLSSPLLAILPSSISPIPSPVVTPSLANTISPLPLSQSATVVSLQQPPASLLSELLGNAASLSASPLVSSSLAPALPLLPLQIVPPVVAALSSVLAPPIIPAVAATSVRDLTGLGLQSAILPSFALPTLSHSALSLPLALTALANAPATVESIAIPLATQVLPPSILTAAPVVPSLANPTTMSSLVAPGALTPSSALPLLQLPLLSIVPAPLPLSSILAIPEVPINVPSASFTEAPSLPTSLTESTLPAAPIDLPLLPTAGLSGVLPSSLGGPASNSLPNLPVISPLVEPDIQGTFPLIASEVIGSLPSASVPDINSPPTVGPSAAPIPVVNTPLVVPGLLNGLLPTAAGDAPVSPLLGLVVPTSIAVAQLPAIPSIVVPVVPGLPSVAIPEISVLPEIPGPLSSPSPESPGVPPINLPGLDVTSALLAVPTALQQLPGVVETPLNAVPTLASLDGPTSLSPLSQITNLPPVQIPEIPNILPAISLPSQLGSPVALPSLEAVAASALPIAQEPPLAAPSLPIPNLGGLPAVPSPAAIVSNILSPLVAPLSAIEPTPSPTSRPGAIEQGTVYGKSYTWTFFRNGAVRVNSSYLVPTADRFVGFLPDDTLVGLFVDGLHIGEHLVPYPEAYLALIIRYHLDVAPLELLNSILQD